MSSYQFLPKIVLRTPFYSSSCYELERVPGLLADKAFRNALWLASPGFYQVLGAKGFDFWRLSAKEKFTLYKYFNRMSYRPTPFGSFACFTLLDWADAEEVRLAKEEQVLLHLAPDQEVKKFIPLPARLADSWIMSPLIYPSGAGRYRNICSLKDEKGKYHFSVNETEGDPFYDQLTSFMDNKEKTGTEIKQWISAYAGCGPEEASEQLSFLTSEQFLYPAELGSVISWNLADEKTPSDIAWGKALPRGSGPRALSGVPALAQLSQELEAIFKTGLRSDRQWFYAAAERPVVSGGLSLAEQAEFSTVVMALQRLSLPSRPGTLSAFAAAFQAKFDQQRVPLLKALDPDLGIPYNESSASTHQGEELLKDLHFPQAKAKATEITWTDIHRLLLKIWRKAGLGATFDELQITQADLKEIDMSSVNGAFPNTIAVMFRKTADAWQIESAGGATATSLAGRLSYFSREVAELCAGVAALESAANPDVVFADIAHFADEHVDNINCRAKVYPYEIPLNVYSAAPVERQLLPSDLVLSVQGGQLIMESIRLQKRVIPRLSTAYNYQNAELGVFRLLCDLQHQGLRSNLSFDLERLFPGLDYYPRVSFEKAILSLAKWKFLKADLELLAGAGPKTAVNVLRTFRNRFHLPRQVSVGGHDQLLVFDLAVPAEAFFFIQTISGQEAATVTEYLLCDKSVKSGHHTYNGQFVTLLHLPENRYQGLGNNYTPLPEGIRRDFPPGSEWLYLKLYCTPISADHLLRVVISTVVQSYEQDLSKWFFIRYTDQSGHHLRLRFQISPSGAGGLMSSLLAALDASGAGHLVKELQGDTYRRELERYGPALIALAESIFCAGSQLLLARLTEAGAEGAEAYDEFGLGVYTAMEMSACFLKTTDEQIGFFDQLTEGFLIEFRTDKKMRVEMDIKYRELRDRVASALQKDHSGPHGNGSGRTQQLLSLMRQAAAEAANESAGRRHSLLSSLIHMQLNRTFRSEPRRQEMLVYFCLSKHLRSLKARQVH